MSSGEQKKNSTLSIMEQFLIITVKNMKNHIYLIIIENLVLSVTMETVKRKINALKDEIERKDEGQTF